MENKIVQNFVPAPLGNTGVTRTSQSLISFENKEQISNLTQFSLIDWLEFTIHHQFSTELLNYDPIKNRNYVDTIYLENQVYRLFNDLFGISSNDIIYEKRGRNCYTELYYYKNILCWCSTDIRMGFHFEISGQGCRLLELLNIDIFYLLAQLKGYITKFTRIDLSIDDFTNNYYTVPKLKKYLSNGLVVSKLRTYYDIKSGSFDSELLGNTLQLGSKAGLIHITFYDKLLERESNNYIVSDDVKFWTRTEVRFRHEKAQDVVDHLIIKRDINSIVKGVLKDYVRFVEKSKTDSKKSRWNNAIWWDKFLYNIDSIKLASPRFYTTIERKREWLKDDVSKTQLMCLLGEIDLKQDNCSSELILMLLKKGYTKIKESDLQMINDYRLDNGLSPLFKEEVEDYIRSLKDIIIINKDKF